LITIDTLRADHVGARRDGMALTPSLDRFAKDAVVYSDALANASMTLPSHASMLTGLYPWRHRVLSNDHVLPAGVPTLAELLAARGFATGAVVSSFPLVAERSGMGRGFQSYDEHFNSSELNRTRQLVKTPDETTRVAAAWLAAHRGGPLFLWVHYFPPHGPYNPPAEFLEGLKEAAPDPARALRVSKLNFEPRAIPAYQKFGAESEPEAYRRRYAGYVRYVDHHVGALLRAVENAGLYKDATILIASDHGESLGEHGWFFCHGNLVYDEQVRIPLLLKLPRNREAGRVVGAPVESVDFVPTLLRILGLDGALQGDGRVILPEALGAPARPRFTQSNNAELVAILDGPRKLVLRFPKPEPLVARDHPERELFDLGRDPAEQANLAASEAATLARLDAELRKRYEGLDVPPVSLTPEQEERLRSLGYVR
jgi:arylsulfatase A-like enzyme